MKIAVLVGGIRFDSQRRIVNGILEKAAQENVEVFVFTCDAWTYSSTQYNIGEMNIFRLPDFSRFDGIILHGDTIYNQAVNQEIVEKIRALKVPCVSLSVHYDGMLYLGMENENGISEIVDHLVQVHGAKTLNYISGPSINADAIGRLKAFKEGLVRNGIPVEEKRIYFGDYHPDSGKDAITTFCEEMPEMADAIVAANDEMALGAYYELKRRGYEVPDDVLLTGYDYAMAGRNHYPKITSVKRPEKELGRRAVNKLLQIYYNQPVTEAEELLGKPIFTESCGCKDNIREGNRNFRAMLVQDKLHVTTFSEIVKSSSADFTGVGTFEQLIKQIRKYLYMIEPEGFYMCMNTEEKNNREDLFAKVNPETMNRDITSYTDEMSIPIAYENGKFSSCDSFRHEEILPEEYMKNWENGFFTILPMHFQERCYGYCVLVNSRLLIDSEIFHLFIMNINNAMENIRKQDMLNHMVDRLNKMWVYDTLTGIFNRAGFFKFAPSIIEEANQLNQKIFVLFLDLDGLKYVNDHYGHDEGDIFIKAMATILSKEHRHGELLMRYGGDEFVVFARGYSERDAKEYVARLREDIENYNAKSDRPFTLDASMGYTIMEAAVDCDIEEIIEFADQEMYKEKREKKNSRK